MEEIAKTPNDFSHIHPLIPIVQKEILQTQQGRQLLPLSWPQLRTLEDF